MATQGIAAQGIVVDRCAICRFCGRTLDRGAIHDDDNLALSN